MNYDKKELISTIKKEYDGKEGLFWEFLMGRHIHTGGFYSTQDLSAKAAISPSMSGVEFCCNNGQSMRFLIRYRGVKHMTGVELSPVAIERGRNVCLKQGFMKDKTDESRVKFIEASITEGLPMLKDASFDFVFAEDSWCYIPDKADLIKTAARIIKPGGTLAFTDWCLGPNYKKMTDSEYQRFLKLMTFPNLGSVDSYSEHIKDAGLEIKYAHYTGRWLPCHQTYIAMMENQMKGDILDLFDNDLNEYDRIMKDFYFMLEMAKQGKLGQGLFVAKKKGGQSKGKL